PYADEMKIELLQALAQQTAVAFQLRELLEQSRQSAVIEERANLARELHDTLLQGFTGVTLQLRALLRRPPDSPEETRFRLARIEREATDAVQEARRAVGDMRGGFSLVPVSESEDVVAGIATLVHQARSNTDSDLIWQARGRLRLLDSLATVVILRIAREALGNALRHGKPTRVMITLAFQPAQVELKIEDNGQGFDTSVLPTIGEKHFGIVGMRERAESLGGGIQITSEIGVGTTVVATLPA
ncbi:MAG TPA: sensor histidine kinase, partial [Bryobacteraceae bacterium]|nr:sensor histidine kinase [Bryobacteraceae bacterium]